MIYSTNIEQHIEHVKKVIERTISYNLKINYKKSEFFTQNITYLGYKISKLGIQFSESKNKAIQNIKKPTNIKTLHSFIGLASYFRKFIKNFALHCSPLTKLLKKNEKFVWNEQQEKAYTFLKNELIKEPILTFPDYNKEFIVTLDVCAEGIGALLSRIKNEKEVAIAYASRITTRYEKNYFSHELEGLGLLFALKIWRVYLLGKKFKIRTDNIALTFIKQNKNHTNKLARWAFKIQEYDFDIVHTKGKNNKVADCLSRNIQSNYININKEG